MIYKIEFTNAGKRYKRDWIFRKFDYTFQSGNSYAILGANGSGKSTLLKSVLGYNPLTEGELHFFKEGREVKPGQAYKNFSICSPYLELYEELTMKELIRFQGGLKPYLKNYTPQEFAEITELEKALNKQIKYFSSGMKQRLRIALAILCNTEVVLLDEPTSNLDSNAINWYKNLVESYKNERIFVVASNKLEDDYFFCKEMIHMEEFKG